MQSTGGLGIAWVGGGLGVNMNEPTNQWNIRVRRGEVKAGILLTQDSAGCLKE